MSYTNPMADTEISNWIRHCILRGSILVIHLLMFQPSLGCSKVPALTSTEKSKIGQDLNLRTVVERQPSNGQAPMDGVPQHQRKIPAKELVPRVVDPNSPTAAAQIKAQATTCLASAACLAIKRKIETKAHHLNEVEQCAIGIQTGVLGTLTCEKIAGIFIGRLMDPLNDLGHPSEGHEMEAEMQKLIALSTASCLSKSVGFLGELAVVIPSCLGTVGSIGSYVTDTIAKLRQAHDPSYSASIPGCQIDRKESAFPSTIHDNISSKEMIDEFYGPFSKRPLHTCVNSCNVMFGSFDTPTNPPPSISTKKMYGPLQSGLVTTCSAASPALTCSLVRAQARACIRACVAKSGGSAGSDSGYFNQVEGFGEDGLGAFENRCLQQFKDLEISAKPTPTATLTATSHDAVKCSKLVSEMGVLFDNFNSENKCSLLADVESELFGIYHKLVDLDLYCKGSREMGAIDEQWLRFKTLKEAWLADKTTVGFCGKIGPAAISPTTVPTGMPTYTPQATMTPTIGSCNCGSPSEQNGLWKTQCVQSSDGEIRLIEASSLQAMQQLCASAQSL